MSLAEWQRCQRCLWVFRYLKIIESDIDIEKGCAQKRTDQSVLLNGSFRLYQGISPPKDVCQAASKNERQKRNLLFTRRPKVGGHDKSLNIFHWKHIAAVFVLLLLWQVCNYPIVLSAWRQTRFSFDSCSLSDLWRRHMLHLHPCTLQI